MTKKTIFLIFILAVVIRIGAFLYFEPLDEPRTWEYEDIAKNLAGGDGFKNVYLGTTYYSATTPLYPFICAAVYKIFGINHNIVVFLQIMISSLMCVVIFDLGRRVADEKIGLISALLCVFHPGLVLYSVTKVHPLVLDALFLSATLWSFMRLKEKVSIGRAIAAGVITGVCILTRSSIVVFVPIGFIWLLWFSERKAIRDTFSALLLFTIAMFAVISPWVVRNFLIQKEFVLTSSADAEVFWRGNNPNATGTSFTLSGNTVLKEDRVFYNKLLSMNELEQRHYFRKESLKFVKENPGRTLKLFFKKFYYFWWFSPSSGILYPSGYLLAYKCLYGFFVISAAIGFCSVVPGRFGVDFKNFILLLLFLLSISLFQSLFYVEGRHRWGIEPVFLIVSAIGAASIFQNATNFRKARKNANIG